MYLHLGGGTLVPETDIVGVFDLDNSSQSRITRSFLAEAERAGRVINVAEDIPKSFVVCRDGCGEKVFLSQMSTQTLLRRAEEDRLF